MSDLLFYSLSTVLVLTVLLGIFLMSKVKTARLGNGLSALSMLLAIILILVRNNILNYYVLYFAMAIGLLLGILLGAKVKMIQMPQMVALLNAFGGAASAVVGAFALSASEPTSFSLITGTAALDIGVVTLIGSLVAAGKLHRLLSQRPIILKGHRFLTAVPLFLMVAAVFLTPLILSGKDHVAVFVVVNILMASAFGFFFSIRVGGADMPVTISLLNSLSGLAGAIAGLAIKDVLLTAVGAVVGASGLLLTQVMCKAINRSLVAIILGKTSQTPTESKKDRERKESKEEETPNNETPNGNNPILYLKKAKKVIIVPGYGMAIAQAQHLVKKLADFLKAKGAEVKYAVHPVAGRMPGHMNVLLCEADVDYDDLHEMKEINDEFVSADAVIVVGANDVLNPAAKEAEGTPIYGMPVLNVDQCKHIYIFNYDDKPGYAGVANPLYLRKEGVFLYFGDAGKTLSAFLAELKKEE